MTKDYSKLEPIDEYIEPFKRTSSVHYGFHSYFTTQPYNVVQKYISTFSNPGDLIADPFVGSGVTAVESLRIKRRTFALDLNPFAVFMTKAKCSYADINHLREMFDKTLNVVEDECQEVEDLTKDKVKKLTIPYWYPKDVKLPSNADRTYLHEIFTKKQLFQLSFIKNEIDKFPDSNEKDLLLILFCGTLSRANIAYSLPDDGRSIYSGDFTIFHTGRYRVPKNIVEIPVLPVFKRRFEDIVKAKEETNKLFKDFVNKDTFKAVVGSATNLKPYLKNQSVDYVYTDPPYGGHIAYLDLSIVYNSWLKLDVTEEMKRDEVIEGGELKHTRQVYMNLLRESLGEISRVLKPNRWMSLVFSHKEPVLWTNIVEAAKSVGLEYKNSVVQGTKLPSWHKVDVPQSVLSSQMIINFIRKENAYFEFIDDKLTLNQLILNVAEREIYNRHGATLEEIITALVPELFEHNYIDEEAQTKTDKIFKLLAENFTYRQSSKIFEIKEENNKKIGNYIPMQDKIKYYLISYMRRIGSATLEDIIPAILPKLVNGEAPSGEDILVELERIAKFEKGFWVFVHGNMQPSFNFDIPNTQTQHKETKIPAISEHDQIIYRLALLANRYNLISKIGNQEQKEPYLKALNRVQGLKYESVYPKDVININEIDCLWFAKNNKIPIFAFEVEHSTSITSAFERFISLLKVANDIGNQRRLILVISRKNTRQFNTKIRESSYIGSPHYLNNKIRYIFEEDLINRLSDLIKETDSVKFEGILREPQLG